MLTAKLQEGGGPVDDKSRPDKNCGNYKKSDVTFNCQCVCHSRANTATTSAKPDVVDLTVSPCKETAPLPPPPSEHGKYLSLCHFNVVASETLKLFLPRPVSSLAYWQ